MSDKHIKEVRKQLRGLTEEMLPSVIKDELLEEIKVEMTRALAEIEKYNAIKLSQMDAKIQETMKHITENAPKWLKEYQDFLNKKDSE